MNLLYQLIICRVTHGSAGAQRWDMGSGEVLAHKSHVVSLHAAAAVELRMPCSTGLGSKPGQRMALHETHGNGYREGEYSSVSELV